MRTISLLCAFAAALTAQTTLTLSGPATARPGATVALSLSANGPAGSSDTGAVAFQIQLGLPAGYSVTTAAGSAATLASKTVACTTDQSFCLLYGLNVTVVGNGQLATYSLKVPTAAAPGPVTIGLSNALGASAAAAALPVTIGTPYTLTILAKQDINGDGKVDTADVQLMVNQVVAAQTSPSACVNDLTGDGKCDLLDVINVLLKALGQ